MECGDARSRNHRFITICIKLCARTKSNCMYNSRHIVTAHRDAAPAELLPERMRTRAQARLPCAVAAPPPKAPAQSGPHLLDAVEGSNAEQLMHV